MKKYLFSKQNYFELKTFLDIFKNFFHNLIKKKG